MGRRNKLGYIVAIDGPAGAGKSTVSRQLALNLRGRLLDTGAMYRSVAYFASKKEAMTALELSKLSQDLVFEYDSKNQSLFVNGSEMGHRLRSQKVSSLASKISALKGV